MTIGKVTIRLQNAGLDDKDGEIVAHGWLDFEAMGALKVDKYQREEMGAVGGKKNSIRRAVENGVRLPDIMLGMRGEKFEWYKDAMILEDPVFIVDGLQRIFGIKTMAELKPELIPGLRIGAEVRFNTNFDRENELFQVLNTSRIGVSPNVLLRNMRTHHPAILTLYGLTESDSSSPIYKRVQWNQRMQRGELLTGLIMAQTVSALHRPNTGVMGDTANKVTGSLSKIVESIGLRTLRENSLTFFNVVDSMWGIRSVQYRITATHLRGNFLAVLAKLLANHSDFWDGNKLVVSADQRKKLKSFPMQDPEIIRLASAGRTTGPILLHMLKEHFNKGKRQNRLHARAKDDE